MNLSSEWLALADARADASPPLRLAIHAWRAQPDAPDVARRLLYEVTRSAPRDAERLLEAAPDDERLLLQGTIFARTGRLDASIVSLEEAALAARETGHADRLAWILAELGRSLCMAGSDEEGAAALEEALLLSQEPTHRGREAMIRTSLGFAAGERHDPANYAFHTERAVELFRQIGDEHGLCHAQCNLAGALQTLGKLDEAEALYRQVLPQARAREWVYLEALGLAGLGGVAFRRGIVHEGFRGYAAAESRLETIGYRAQIAYHRFVVARYLLDLDRPDDALVWCGRVLAEDGTVVRPHVRFQVHGVRAAALAALSRFREASEARRAQVELSDELRDERIERARRIAAARYRALDAWRSAEAERMLREAAEAHAAELEAALAVQKELRATLEHISRTDALTGVVNRRHVDAEIQREIERARRGGGNALALVLLDLDHFKEINDEHGHAVGDEVLIEVCRRIEARLRVTDVLGRWGGEEFAILLTETAAEGAVAVAQDLERRISHVPFDTSAGPIRVTASFGVTSLLPSDERSDHMLLRADRALYRAKRSGRACVVELLQDE